MDEFTTSPTATITLPTDYLLRVASIARLPEPRLISRAEAIRGASESARSFLAESRRVDSRRMRGELGVALRYHDLDRGIEASLEEI